MADVQITGEDRRLLLKASINAIRQVERIEWILDDIGFPAGDWPGQSASTEQAWRSVLRQLDAGVLDRGYPKLIAVLHDRYPVNPHFTALHQRYVSGSAEPAGKVRPETTGLAAHHRPAAESAADRPGLDDPPVQPVVRLAGAAAGTSSRLILGGHYTAEFGFGPTPLHEPGPPGAATPAETAWIVRSTTAELRFPPGQRGEAAAVEVGDRTQWMATFSLPAPAAGRAPAAARLELFPVGPGTARLDVQVTVAGRLLRADVEWPVHRPPPRAQDRQDDGPSYPDLLSRLRPPDDPPAAARSSAAALGSWRSPGQSLRIELTGHRATIMTSPGGVERPVEWNVPLAVEQDITATRQALDQVRQKHSGLLELIDPAALRERLDAVTGPMRAEFSGLPAPGISRPWGSRRPGLAQEQARAADTLLASDEFYKLAFQGHLLYNRVFSSAELRTEVDRLDPGDLLELRWWPLGGVAVPRLPLGLLYRAVPARAAVDPMEFLGLRFRLGYTAYPSHYGYPALGPWRQTTRLHALYWDSQGEIAAETARHRTELARWDATSALPPDSRADALAALLSNPADWSEVVPVSLLYFYCLLDQADAADPGLRFGRFASGGQRNPDVLRFSDLGIRPMPSRPVVFMNVCDSAGSGLISGNRLEQLFFDRGCRAYIGTEAKVPAGLAARFATTVLSFLLDAGSWDQAAPVTEAVAQARVFLWEEFGSLAGLFYGHVNDHRLTRADTGSP